jgi:hypothetical protein
LNHRRLIHKKTVPLYDESRFKLSRTGIMKKLLSLLLLLVGISVGVQAQATCDLQEFSDYYNRAIEHYWDNDFAGAIADYTCAIELIPADVMSLETYVEREDYAAAYLNRGWSYLQNGEYHLSHPDFYRWAEITETETVEQSLADAMAGGNLPMTDGLSYRLSFEGEASQIWGFAGLTADSIDPLFILLDPSGNVLVSDDDGGINLDSVIRRYTLPETGTYTLVISQAGGSGTGEMELALYQDGEITSTNPDNPNLGFAFAAYYLYAGETAEVFTTEGDNLNVRSGAGTGFEIIARLPSGSRVTLLEGPYKEGGGYAWWLIRTSDGVEGYAVERVETEQTLQLALFNGEEAVVTSAPDLLNVRENPTRSSDVIFQLEDGALVTILDDEPVTADGYRWWHIRDASGQEGWAVDRIGIERTLAPMREFPQG